MKLSSILFTLVLTLPKPLNLELNSICGKSEREREQDVSKSFMFSRCDSGLGTVVAQQASELTSVHEKLQAMVSRLEAVHSKLEATESKLEATGSKLEATESKLEATKTELERKLNASETAARGRDQGEFPPKESNCCTMCQRAMGVLHLMDA